MKAEGAGKGSVENAIAGRTEGLLQLCMPRSQRGGQRVIGEEGGGEGGF